MATQQDVVITAKVHGSRLSWLKRELDAAGLPYQVERHGDIYHVRTLEAAAPTIDRVVNHKAKNKHGGPPSWPMDIRVLAFAASLAMVVGVWMESEGIIAPAAGAGLNPDLARAAGILIGGVVVTLLMSELVLKDDRRWMFILAMVGLFLAAALWFVGVGLGLPMGEALGRLMP